MEYAVRSTEAPTSPATSDDIIPLAVERLRDGGIAAIPEVLNGLADQKVEASDDAIVPVLRETVGAIIDAFAGDGRSPAVYAATAALDPAMAAAAFNVLLLANFPDGEADLGALEDPAILTFAALLNAAQRHDMAEALLEEAISQRPMPSLRHAVFVTRCRAAECPEAISAYWTDADAGGDLAGARAAAQARQLDPLAHRNLARRLFEGGAWAAGLNALAIGLTLPIETSGKLALAEDIALVAAMLFARGDGMMLEQKRVRWALAATPEIPARAAAIVAQRVTAGELGFAKGAPAAKAVDFLRSLGDGTETKAPLSPYRTHNGKPHVDIVWLEVTNHCNQKCTFCPDMFREEARTWLPLAEVKRLIDEMVDTISVGSMQLNAYGEPLLHPNIDEIIAYIRDKKLPWPTFFTSHGMTLVEKKLKQLSHNYPSGIAISLHNDSQESYAATRSAKIGDYDTLVSRVTALVRQMVNERASSHLRLYQMVCNGKEDQQVDAKTRAAFPDSPERMAIHVRKWERIAAEIAASAAPEAHAEAVSNSDEAIAKSFFAASHDDGHQLTILRWVDENGRTQRAFMSPRPVGTYANLLLEYDDRWLVERKPVNPYQCGFTKAPSLAIFATGRLGICCLDLNSTATFGSISDFGSLREALESPQALTMFAQVANGIAVSRGCQICLGSGKQLCAA